MSLLQWEPRYSVMIDEVDDDHRAIFTCINQLWGEIEAGSTPAAIIEALKRLSVCMAEHFEREERLLSQWEYPQARRHAREHQDFLALLQALVVEAEGGKIFRLNEKTLSFVSDWLCSHILKSDISYSRFLHRRESSSLAGRWGKILFSGLRRLGSPSLALGAALTVALAGLVLEGGHQRENARFREVAERRIASLRSNLTSAQDAVSILANHFKVTPFGTTGRDEFSQLCLPVVTRHPFIRGLEWIPRVPGPSRAVFESLAARDGFGDFRFTEIGPDGALIT